VREQTEVVAVEAGDAGSGFHVGLADGSLHAQHVVIATGPFQRARIPAVARDVTRSVLQTDPTRYRGPGDLPSGEVLVVGSGASGCQIADELLRAGRRVYLSVSRHRRAPRRIRGRDFYWWLEKMGRFAQTIDSFPGRQWPPSVVVTGVNGGYDVNVRQLAADGVQVLGRVVGAAGNTITVETNANEILDGADKAYADFLAAARDVVAAGVQEELGDEEVPEPSGLPRAVPEVDMLDLTRENVTTIVWATGYRYDFGWVKVPVFDEHGRPIQDRGITPWPGLYFLGLHWMHTFKSGLFSGVGSDAEHLAQHITRSEQT
jgi:putative flavoprotein involved in K+ transport